MKKLIVIAVIFMTSLSQAQVSIDWSSFPGGVSIVTDTMNNVYTANWDYNPAGDITLTKRNSAGNILWENAYNNIDNTKHEVATWLEIDYHGDVIVSGTIRSGFSNPVNAASVLMKFDSLGTLKWRVVYESSFDGSSTTKCLVDINNNIYVLGIGTGPNGQVTKVKKFDEMGVTMWDYFDASAGGAPINFKFTPDNHIVIIQRAITGNINGYSKIDLNGNHVWSLIGGINSISIGDAAGDAAGNTYIINGAPSELKKLSPTGAEIWTQVNTFNGNKVEVGTDNNPVIGGYPAVNYGAVIMKYDSSGNFIWQNLDADGSSLALLALAPMKLDAANNAYLAGSTMSQMGMCKVNSDGTSAWATTTSSGYPVWFEFGKDSCIYLVGGTTAKLCENIVTIDAPSINNKPSNVLEIYPNPVSEKLQINSYSNNQTMHTIEIINATGNKVIEIFTPENYVDVSSLKKGIYCIRFIEYENIRCAKFIIER